MYVMLVAFEVTLPKGFNKILGKNISVYLFLSEELFFPKWVYKVVYEARHVGLQAHMSRKANGGQIIHGP